MSARGVRWALLALTACAILVAACCYGFSRFANSEPLRIEVIIKTTDDSIEFWQTLKAGIEVAASEFGAQVEVTGSKTDADVDEQIALVEQALARKPDAVILAANDYNRLVPVSEKVARSGIAFFIVDSGIASDIPSSVVATDNVKAGRQAGEEMLRRLSGTAKVAIINYTRSAASLKDREEGVRSVLGERTDVSLLGTYDAEGSLHNAYEIAASLIRKYPDLRGIVGLNEQTSVGAGQAIRDMGRQDRIRLIGFDSSMDEVKLLEEGVMQATIIQQPFQMGYLSVKTAVDKLHRHTVPKRIDTGSLVITKQNMYDEENQKLLFPFYDNR